MPEMLSPLLAVLALLLATPGAAQAEEPRVFLSWGAPHGRPGATGSLLQTCGDTTLVDTLHLTFDPGRSCSTFVGMTATLWFTALDGDSLGPLWQTRGGTSLPPGMTLEFASDSTNGDPFPWTGQAIGTGGYVKMVPKSTRLRLIYAVPPAGGARVEGGRHYALARLLVRRPAAGAPGCDQPVCVGWVEGTMAYRPGDEPVVSSGARFVGINAEGGEHSCGAALDRSKPPRGRDPKSDRRR